MEWFFYQSLLGAWPPKLQLGNAEGMRELKGRMVALMQKATREAKLRTSWTQPADDYELALGEFVERVLDPARSGAFLRDFVRFAEPVILAGALNSLSQLLLKLVCPGTPDIYQGTELWDLSLVDPDNRRAVDFELRQRALEDVRRRLPGELVEDWSSAALKLRLLADGLAVRRSFSRWEEADYLPLLVEGPAAGHLLALARTFGDDVVVAVAVRRGFELLCDQVVPYVPAERWGDTRITLPSQLRELPLFNAVTREAVQQASGTLAASHALAKFPVALLSTRQVE